MPSAKHRIAKAAKKKEQAALTPAKAARKDPMTADTSQGAITTTVETLHEIVDPTNNNTPDESRPDDMELCPYYIGEIGKKTFKSIGAVFKHWVDQPIKENSLYNAAHPENRFHADWLMYQEAFRKKDEVDAPPRMPYHLIGETAWHHKHPLHVEWLEYQETFRTGRKKDKENVPANASELSVYVEPSASRAKNCSYWPLGKCRDRDGCRYYHDPAKASETPRPRAALPNGRWR
ncbi:hypothetical protein DPSP01_009761 [Paraphaeosphaeria sporulosa]